jgi:prefoldin subunit 5
MRERLEQRLQELRAEYESGQKMLADLEARQEELRNTLMRISGAILVLEEELERESQSPEDG